VYTDLHDIFLGEFLNILDEWLERLVENTGRYQNVTPRKWTSDLVRQLNSLINTNSHASDFWLNRILGGYIMELVVDCT
jgi:hypothetical protein